jgi:hypothetical protein
MYLSVVGEVEVIPLWVVSNREGLFASSLFIREREKSSTEVYKKLARHGLFG